ncbi:MAG: alpha glucosidase [Azospirillaceae bacterium]|nr:alpha glucosidase [Azospirillaceae bacterium]
MTVPPVTTADPTRETAGADWWQGAVIYQIYPRSFCDTNGDGIGDLAGITRHIDEIAALGVDALWLSPFFTSPMQDFGYDVADYCDVDPLFGTLADFDTLVATAQRHGLKIIIDLVLSHTADQHPWFATSRTSRDNAKANWYVWADPKPDGTPPSNWLSVFGGSAWAWESRRRQYYLHNFLTSQPDLNFHEPAVQDALLDVARFWLARGVAGFRLDTVNFYFHDAALRDNPPAPPGAHVSTVAPVNPYAYQLHLYDKNRPENLAFLERLRRVMDAFPGTMSVGEIGSDHDVYALTAAYTERGCRLHMAYNFDLLGPFTGAAVVRRSVEAMEAGIGTGWPSWAFSNHDSVRMVTRWHHEADRTGFAPVAVALLTCLRGTPCLYQGEELGLTEADVPFERIQDPYGKAFWPEYKGRDGCRTPMPWTDSNPGAGFSNAEPWLPIPADHRAAAVAVQAADPASPLSRIRSFLQWRRGFPALKTGTIRFLDAPDPGLLLIRTTATAQILCAFNLGATAIVLPLARNIVPMPLTGHGFDSRVTGNGIELPPFGAFFGVL